MVHMLGSLRSCAHTGQPQSQTLRSFHSLTTCTDRLRTHSSSQNCRRSSRLRVVAEEAPEKLSGVKEGTRIKVSRPLQVWHSPKFKEGLEMEGREGEVLGDVSQFKGKVLSSTLPYKIQFLVQHEEAGEVKVIAHLNGTEFEPL